MSNARDTRRLPAILFGIAFGTAVGLATLPPEHRSDSPSEMLGQAPQESDLSPQGQRLEHVSSAATVNPWTNPSHPVAAALEDPATRKREDYEQMGKAIFDDANLFREYISDLVSWGDLHLAEVRADEYDSIHRNPESQDLGFGVLTLVDALRDSGLAVDAENLLDVRATGT